MRAHNCSVKIDNDPTVREVGAPARPGVNLPSPPREAQPYARALSPAAGTHGPPLAIGRVSHSASLARAQRDYEADRPTATAKLLVMLSLVDTKHPGIARPTLRSVRTLVALAHTIRNEVSTPLVALEAAGAAARPCAWLRR